VRESPAYTTQYGAVWDEFVSSDFATDSKPALE